MFNWLCFQSEKFRTSTLTHHTSTPSLNSLPNNYSSAKSSINQTANSTSLMNGKNLINPINLQNGGSEQAGQKSKSKELKADQQLRQILGKDTVECDSKWASLPGLKRRPSVPVNSFHHHQAIHGNGNGIGNSHGSSGGLHSNVNMTDDDEILESLVKTATSHSRLDTKKKTKSTRFTERKSCK